MAEVATRAPAVENALLGAPWNEATVDAAAARLAEDFAPMTDMRASSAYRLRVAGNLLRRCYLEYCDPREPARVADAAAAVGLE
jgi:xanthine dehydrogenase small subunit